MNKKIWMIIAAVVMLAFAGGAFLTVNQAPANAEGDFIKWLDFNPKAELLTKVYELDVVSMKKPYHFEFVPMLAYLACQNGNRFQTDIDIKNMSKIVKRVESGENFEEIASKSKYYKYYLTCYTAIFREYIGWHTVGDGAPQYGLKAYFPLAAGYGYSGGDDFGNSRNYGFKRIHLGHDMFGAVGTPVIAIEGGTVTELGWNTYGGWRVGVRSNDGLRYYYYAHLRKDKPYPVDLKKGDAVQAGEVVGYLGVTGYSKKENVNMKSNPHLHFGLQLIFDPSQEDGPGEIWIDVYQLTRFLVKNRAKTERIGSGYSRSYGLKTPCPAPARD